MKIKDTAPHLNENLDEMDEKSILCLELMDQLITCKKEMENSLREGYFLLGKARYIMGVHAVSMLQIPSLECDIQPLYCSSKTEESFYELSQLTNYQFTIHPNESNSEKIEDENDGNSTLRKRGTQTEDLEEKEENDDEEELKSKIVDPLHWFSALPPQSLRKAQQQFKQALMKSAECATIQSKLNALQK